MKLLLYSGLLYLIMVSVVLILRPKLMFTENGTWKEFGLGRDPERYTVIPFWLFAIISAIVSYIIVLMIAGADSLPGVTVINERNSAPSANMNSKNTLKPASNMKDGFYILDAEATAKTGIPKYIFLGKEAPNLIYNKSSEMNSSFSE